jgi:hypothetical protein
VDRIKAMSQLDLVRRQSAGSLLHHSFCLSK